MDRKGDLGKHVRKDNFGDEGAAIDPMLMRDGCHANIEPFTFFYIALL